ncbi:toprim domain-containing protein [Micromonospora sp. NPDC049101]|uniref:toprim domain-containing protein n=1 Tax=Micromonospora sp. NPDC049101 TaxID=3155032 RepID=UPI003401E5CF
MTSLVPSNSSKSFMGEAMETYYQTLKTEAGSAAVEYLKSRALSGASGQSFRLGYVANPLPGHEQYTGMLCVPYITRSGVVTLRFRALPDPNPEHDPSDPESAEYLPIMGPKYKSVPGEMPRLYNTPDLDRREPFVCITEGEFDAMIAHQAGLPAVAIPGVNGWSDWWGRCFKGYEAVYILSDNDPLKKKVNCRPCADEGLQECKGHNVGAESAEKLAAKITNARVVMMPPGHDVNSFVKAEGPDALVAKIGVKL